jgi:hypothetical protein
VLFLPIRLPGRSSGSSWWIGVSSCPTFIWSTTSSRLIFAGEACTGRVRESSPRWKVCSTQLFLVSSLITSAKISAAIPRSKGGHEPIKRNVSKGNVVMPPWAIIMELDGLNANKPMSEPGFRAPHSGHGGNPASAHANKYAHLEHISGRLEEVELFETRANDHTSNMVCDEWQPPPAVRIVRGALEIR